MPCASVPAPEGKKVRGCSEGSSSSSHGAWSSVLAAPWGLEAPCPAAFGGPNRRPWWGGGCGGAWPKLAADGGSSACPRRSCSCRRCCARRFSRRSIVRFLRCLWGATTTTRGNRQHRVIARAIGRQQISGVMMAKKEWEGDAAGHCCGVTAAVQCSNTQCSYVQCSFTQCSCTHCTTQRSAATRSSCLPRSAPVPVA